MQPPLKRHTHTFYDLEKDWLSQIPEQPRASEAQAERLLLNVRGRQQSALHLRSM
jgi:hypothetical protein